MAAMNFGKVLVPLVGIVLIAGAWRSYGWSGVALVVGAMVMFMLLHFNRAIQVLKRAANRPIGTVASAVMLNAKLKPKANLLHVVALTRAIGELRSPQDTQPEIFRWTDAGGSWVDATFVNGKLTEWNLVRPEPTEEAAAIEADAPASDAVKPGATDALRPPV
ncbi:glycerate kinase [Variovorax sp. Sphag1AA]|uniref:glycerate kinase n=1 Tax=Variovorax sp. Sphag1AA TaxID=2587027 RepID=UPI00288942AF|nr:glycerate kinase [Variovorax sp. Sphag1AA]